MELNDGCSAIAEVEVAMRLPPPSPWIVAEYRFRWLMIGFVIGLSATLAMA